MFTISLKNSFPTGFPPRSIKSLILETSSGDLLKKMSKWHTADQSTQDLIREFLPEVILATAPPMERPRIPIFSLSTKLLLAK